MVAGSLKKFLPKDNSEILFCAVAFLLGVLASKMFLSKKQDLIEGEYHGGSCGAGRVVGGLCNRPDCPTNHVHEGFKMKSY